MKISVNNQVTEITSPTTIYDLAEHLQLPGKGIAIAINNKMVPRTEWAVRLLQENDNVVLIKAACGG